MKYARLLASLMICTIAVCAEATDYVALDSGVTLETGDSWIDHGEHYRLYGVQSCLRGTFFTDHSGERRDCGEASIAVLSAFIRDIRPQCATVAVEGDTRFVLCYGTVGSERLDLATALITEGYAFAALDAKGLPIHAPYAVAEQQARARKAGLWQFPDVQHPSLLLSRVARQREGR